MRRNSLGLVLVLMMGCLPAAVAQDVQVSRTNRTVEVIVTETVRVDAEVAVIKIGCESYGKTKDAAYDENVHVANQITQLLLAQGIPKENVETESLRLGRPEEYEGLGRQERSQREFQASPSWTVRLASADAQGLIDLAVKAGANEVEDIDWRVKDPAALEAKAKVAALSKARALASQLATGVGAKLGDLLYVSNEVRPELARFSRGATSAELVTVSANRPKGLQLKLFPKKVEQQATVHAVFAIEQDSR